MNYEFALDKKSAVSFIAGLVVIGVLLFLAGWIVGRQWPTAVSADTASTSTPDERSTVPQEPVLHEEAAALNADAPKSAKRNLELPKEPAQTAPPPATAAAAAVLPGASQSVGEVRIISEAGKEDASAVDDEKAANTTEYVTVQVGVFLDEKQAGRLLQDMERKGYAPTFFSGRDAEARQWYAVRIGVYSDKQQAANAAANFTKQEKIKAVVRPFESL
jgi:cell division septation protein DedD